MFNTGINVPLLVLNACVSIIIKKKETMRKTLFFLSLEASGHHSDLIQLRIEIISISCKHALTLILSIELVQFFRSNTRLICLLVFFVDLAAFHALIPTKYVASIIGMEFSVSNYFLPFVITHIYSLIQPFVGKYLWDGGAQVRICAKNRKKQLHQLLKYQKRISLKPIFKFEDSN